MTEQLALLDLEAPCRRDHAGCGVHHAVWEARFTACWFVRRIGRFESAKCRSEWEVRMRDVEPCNGWLGRAAIERMHAASAVYAR